MTRYEPPKDIWRVNSTLQVNEPLDGAKDPRWVDTYDARGEASLKHIAQALGVDDAWAQLREPPAQGYYLFCGHRGSGKSTELRHLRNQLDSRDLFLVVFADATIELDVHNLRYQDILLHLAAKLAHQLAEEGCDIDRRHLEPLYDWFVERVEKREETKQFALESKAGAEGKLSVLPLVAKVFGSISTAFKTNASYKQELRLTLQNYFSDFAAAFNELVATAEHELDRRVLFVVDGTDRLRTDDAKAFFLTDVHQLQQIRGLFIYGAPIHLAYEEGGAAQNFDMVFHLPMVKVENKDGSPNEDGLQAMQRMLLRRADASLFDAGAAEDLARACGGHPRDLLRLLRYAFLRADAGRFSANSARSVASILQARGQLDEALHQRLNVELPVYEQLGDLHAKAVAYGQLADILQEQGRLEEAFSRRRDDELLLYEQLGDVRGRAKAQGKIADILDQLGRRDEADCIRATEELPVDEAFGVSRPPHDDAPEYVAYERGGVLLEGRLADRVANTYKSRLSIPGGAVAP